MTTLSGAKLKRILTQAGIAPMERHDGLDFYEAIWKAAQTEQREEDAKLLDNFHHEQTGCLNECAAAIREGRK